MTLHPTIERLESARPTAPEMTQEPRNQLPTTARRIGIAVVVTGLVALSVLAAYNVMWTRTAMRDQLDARVKESGTASAAFVQSRWDTLAETLQYYAAAPTFVSLVQAGAQGRAELTRLLLQIQGADPTLVGVSVLSPSGRLMAASVGTEFIGRDNSSRDYFRGVVRAGRTYVSKAYTGERGDLLANVITPINGPSGVVGYLNSARDISKSQQIITTFAKSADLGLTVTDQTGATIATTDKSPLGVVNAANSAWLKPALQGKTGEVTLDTPQGRAVVAYQHLTFGWIVAAQLPRSTVNNPLGQLRNGTIVLTGGLAMMLIFVGVMLHRANRARERAAEQIRAFTEQRARLAREVNDTLVQGLVAVEMAYDLGKDDYARDLLRATSRQARAWVGDLVLETGPLQAGTARRSQPPDHPTAPAP